MTKSESPAIIPSSTEQLAAGRSRPQRVANAIKGWIVAEGLQPGARLPAEPELIERFGMSKGTIREAVRLLEAQGLVRTRTGPGGGAFVNAPSEAQTHALLSNYFYFKSLTITDIYQLRKILEPELVAELALRRTDEQLEALEAAYAEWPWQSPASTAEDERDRHIESLRFHQLLAQMCDNALLGFVIGFTAELLTELTVYKRLFDPPNPELEQKGRQYHRALIDAIAAADAKKARSIIEAHMQMAEASMVKQEAVVTPRFMGGD